MFEVTLLRVERDIEEITMYSSSPPVNLLFIFVFPKLLNLSKLDQLYLRTKFV